MCLKCEISIADLIDIATLVLAIVGSVLGYKQWKKSVILKRAEFINELTMNIRTDKNIRRVIYNIDYGVDWYDEKFHCSGELEAEVDKTLSYFSYICYLREQKLIEDADFCFFKYEIDRILTNNQVQDYLYNLYHFCGKSTVPLSFEYLFKYGEKCKKFDTNFYKKDAHVYDNKYHRYLNF